MCLSNMRRLGAIHLATSGMQAADHIRLTAYQTIYLDRPTPYTKDVPAYIENHHNLTLSLGSTATALVQPNTGLEQY